MRKRGSLVAALAFLALLLVQGAAADQSYSDPAGDAGGAPDVVGIAIAHDAAGTVTMRVSTAQAIPPFASVSIAINADRNVATGGDGLEYIIVGLPIGSSFSAWNGADFVETSPASFRAEFSGATATFTINRADLGNTTGFDFLVLAFGFDGTNIVPGDSAGVFTYDLALAQCGNGLDDDGDGKIDAPADPGCSSATDTDETDPPPPPLKLTAGKPAAMAGPAKAGAAFTVAMTVTRSDGKPFTGAVACRAKAGAATLRAAGRAVAGTARCTMRLPKAAKGKRLTGTITATAGTAKTAKPYAFAIR